MTVPEPETNPESDDGEVDPYAELGVEATSSGADISDGLEAFMDDDDEEEEDLVDGDGFLAADSTLNLDGEVVEDDVAEQEAEEQPVTEEVQ